MDYPLYVIISRMCELSCVWSCQTTCMDYPIIIYPSYLLCPWFTSKAGSLKMLRHRQRNTMGNTQRSTWQSRRNHPRSAYRHNHFPASQSPRVVCPTGLVGRCPGLPHGPLLECCRVWCGVEHRQLQCTSRLLDWTTQWIWWQPRNIPRRFEWALLQKVDKWYDFIFAKACLFKVCKLHYFKCKTPLWWVDTSQTWTMLLWCR